VVYLGLKVSAMLLLLAVLLFIKMIVYYLLDFLPFTYFLGSNYVRMISLWRQWKHTLVEVVDGSPLSLAFSSFMCVVKVVPFMRIRLSLFKCLIKTLPDVGHFR